MEEMSIYFEQQKMLEHPQRSILEKVRDKLVKNLKYLYGLVRLRIVTLNNFDFYYR